jgi:hypothetical protein
LEGDMHHDQAIVAVAHALTNDDATCTSMNSATTSTSCKTHLTRIDLENNDHVMSPKCLQALEKMLQTNYTLAKVNLALVPKSGQKEIMDMYLTMNAKLPNRASLEQATASPEEWGEALGRVSDNLDCLFHLLSLHPSVIGNTNHKTLTTTTTNRQLTAGCSPAIPILESERRRVNWCAKFWKFRFKFRFLIVWFIDQQ